jgi:hypothetical protein
MDDPGARLDLADLARAARGGRALNRARARLLRLLGAAAALSLAAGAVPCRAHPLAPSLLELREDAAGRVLARFATPRLSPAGARVEPVLPARCRALAEPEARLEPARAVVEAALDCGAEGLDGAEIGARGLAETRTDLLLRVERHDGRGHQALLGAGRERFAVPPRASAARVLADYGGLGVRHLLGGADHLLFVGGLFALAGFGRRLLAALTAFTAGHSATLSMVALGTPAPPAALSEIAIAASLVALGVELAAVPHRRLGARAWLLAGGFGLLHGLGFAGALREVGLPGDAVPLALLAFNLGIEAGQVAFVAALAACAAALRSTRAAAGLRAAGAAAWALGGAGVFLALDRAAALLSP